MPRFHVLAVLIVSGIMVGYAANSEAASILYIASNDNAAYKSFAEGLGYTWTFKQNGGSSEQIGGNLDTNRVLNGISQPQKDFINSFDLIISGTDINSSQWQDGSDGAKWAAITKPILVHNPFIARTEGRMGLFGGTSSTHQSGTSAGNETGKIGSDPISNAIFSGVSSPADLYDSTNNPIAFRTTASLGGGIRVAALLTTENDTTIIAYWNAGSLTGAGSTLAAARAYMTLDSNTGFGTLTADGKQVLTNILGQLVPIPEPASMSLLALGAVGLLWRRR